MSYVLQQKHHTYINYDVNRMGMGVWHKSEVYHDKKVAAEEKQRELVSILPAGKKEVEAEKRAEADDVDVAAEVELVQLDESDPLLLLTLPVRDGAITFGPGSSWILLLDQVEI